MSQFGKFKIIERERQNRFVQSWRRVPDEVWEVIGSILIKIVGHSVKGTAARLILISIIAAATHAEVEDIEDLFEK